jgi:exosortase
MTKTERQTSGGWVWISGRAPHAYAISLWLLSLWLFRGTLSSLASLSFHDELASHILLIPLISAILIYLERKRLFRTPRYCPSIGVPMLLLAVILWFSLKTPLSSLHNTDRLSVAATLIVLAWIAIFILVYGAGSFKAAAFPLLFLFLMSPLPVVVAEHAVSVLQKGSAEACYALFRLIGVPIIRHGFRFSLPGVDIEVAEQCSGIHSGLSLFIAGLLAQHILLQGRWKKACFILCILPIAIFKNAVRIVTIAWLGIHVNPDFFHGPLHRQGGLPFSLLSLALLAVLIWLLRRPMASSRTQHPSRQLDSVVCLKSA